MYMVAHVAHIYIYKVKDREKEAIYPLYTPYIPLIYPYPLYSIGNARFRATRATDSLSMVGNLSEF